LEFDEEDDAKHAIDNMDGAELMGLGQIAADGRIDLRLLGAASNCEVSLDLFATGGEDSDDEHSHRGSRLPRGAPPGYFAEANSRRRHDMDPSDPAATGQCCGVARLRVTLVDMSGMDTGKKPDRRSQGHGQGQELPRQNEASVWDFVPRELQNGLPALLGLGPSTGQSENRPAGHHGGQPGRPRMY